MQRLHEQNGALQLDHDSSGISSGTHDSWLPFSLQQTSPRKTSAAKEAHGLFGSWHFNAPLNWRLKHRQLDQLRSLQQTTPG
jgi:hypothetical protein